MTTLIDLAKIGDNNGITAFLNSKPRGTVNKDTDPWNNQTALHAAAAKGHKDTIEILVSLNANINALDIDKMTALHYATERGHLNVVERLITLKANIHAVDFGGCLALHYAADNEYYDISERLIDLHSNVHKTDYRGKSAVDYFEERLTSKEFHLMTLRINYSVRSRLLMFLYGCNLCSLSLPTTGTNIINGTSKLVEEAEAKAEADIISKRSVVRCLEDHYWVRSMLEFIY